MRARCQLTYLAVAMTVVAAAGVVTGCAATTGFGDPDIGVATSQGVTLSVVNRNYEDVRVYLLRGSTQVPVGTVAGMQSRSFRISPAEIGGSRVLRLSLVATASRDRIAMIPVDVEPGYAVEAWIATKLRHSNIRILPQLL